MQASRIEYLFHRFINQECTDLEKRELFEILQQPAHEAHFKELIQSVSVPGNEKELLPGKADQILQQILRSDESLPMPVKKGRGIVRTLVRIAAAALVLIIAGAGYLAVSSNKEAQPKVASSVSKPIQIVPGTDRAMLTMADGTTVVLDSLQNGTLQQAGNTNIKKLGTSLIYNSDNHESEITDITYNTLSTPRGGQFNVVLSDGTRVWLNAASSIRFPTAFSGDSREVELTGEAYFEVAKMKNMPFRVKVNQMSVDVLGTHFNINAYTEEQVIRTSLLEGSVRINNGGGSNLLKPGEQAIIASDDAVKIRRTDMDAVVAWKNGLFEFEGADITTILRQVSRWYDVEIEYQSKIPARRFEGKISREAQLSDLLKILELSNIKFKVEGKKIIVQ